MTKRWIAAFLVLLGCVAIFILQREKAAVPITPRPLLYLLADTQREAERIPLAITRVSDGRETEIGDQIAREYGLTSTLSRDQDARRINAYLNTVGLRVADHVRRKAIHYHFYLQDDPNFVNAFALPGGHIVVGRGLLAIMGSEDELAAVLGHEMVHVDNRHAIERLQYQLASRKVGLGDLYQLGAPAVEIFEAGYTKEQEFEADRVGLELAVAAGYSPMGGVNLMKRFEQLESNYSEHATTPIGEFAQVPFSALVEYFRSHPPAAERREVLEREIKANDWNAAQRMNPFEIQPIFLSDAAAKLDSAGDFHGAIANLKQAVDIDPHYTRAWQALAQTCWRSGDAAGAVQAESEVLQQGATDEDWGLLARGLATSDPRNAVKRLEAFEVENQASTVGQSRSPAAVIELDGLRFLQREKRALVNFQTTLSSLVGVSTQASALREMAWWMCRAGKLTDATRQLEEARQIFPQSSQTTLQLVWVLTDLGRQADAKQMLESIDEDSPSRKTAAENEAASAVVEWHTEERDDAKRDFEAAAKDDPAWMVPRWVQNNYSSTTAGIIAQLQTSESQRRLKSLRQSLQAATRY